MTLTAKALRRLWRWNEVVYIILLTCQLVCVCVSEWMCMFVRGLHIPVFAFLMAYNVWPCVKELSAFFRLSQLTWIQKSSVGLGNTSTGFLPPSPLSHCLPPLFPSMGLSLTVCVCVCVKISMVVFRCCIVAGYYRSNTTQGTEALWVLEQLRAKEQMSSPLAVSLSMLHAGPVGFQPP